MLEFPPRQRSSGVEQLIRNQQVVGSNPTVGSRKTKDLGPAVRWAVFLIHVIVTILD